MIDNLPAFILVAGGYAVSIGGIMANRRLRSRLTTALATFLGPRLESTAEIAGREAAPVSANAEETLHRRARSQGGAEEAERSLASLSLSDADFETALKRAVDQVVSEFGDDVDLRYGWTDLIPDLEFNFSGITTENVRFGLTVYPDRVAIYGKRRDQRPELLRGKPATPWRDDRTWQDFLTSVAKAHPTLTGDIDLEWRSPMGDLASPWVIRARYEDDEGYQIDRSFGLTDSGIAELAST